MFVWNWMWSSFVLTLWTTAPKCVIIKLARIKLIKLRYVRTVSTSARRRAFTHFQLQKLPSKFQKGKLEKGSENYFSSQITVEENKSSGSSSDGSKLFFSHSIASRGQSSDPKDLVNALHATFKPEVKSGFFNRAMSFVSSMGSQRESFVDQRCKRSQQACDHEGRKIEEKS